MRVDSSPAKASELHPPVRGEAPHDGALEALNNFS